MAKASATNGRIAKCLIVNRDGHILLLTIGDHTKYPQLSYLPDLPGGIIEEGETVAQGMVREIAEETGIVVAPSRLLRIERKIVSIPWVKRDIEKWLYTTQVDMPGVTLSYEHESYRWVTIEELRHVHFDSFYFEDFIEPAIAKYVELVESA